MLNEMMVLPEERVVPMDRESLHVCLLKTAVQVSFKKKNGVIRLMRCTQNGSAIPEASKPQAKVAIIDESTGLPVTPKEKDPGLFTVWDLDLGAWRTFKYESLLSVSLNNQEKIV